MCLNRNIESNRQIEISIRFSILNTTDKVYGAIVLEVPPHGDSFWKHHDKIFCIQKKGGGVGAKVLVFKLIEKNIFNFNNKPFFTITSSDF